MKKIFHRLFHLFLFTFIIIGFHSSIFHDEVFAQDASSYDDAFKTVKPVAGYDGGFFIQAPDGDFKIKFNARVDSMFYWQSSNLPDAAGTALDESADQLSFRLRRAQLLTNAYWKKFRAFILIGSGVPGTTYWVANANYSPIPEITIETGVEDPGYDLMSVVSSRKYTMVDATIVQTQVDGEQPVWSFIDPATGTDTPITSIERPSFGLPTQLGLFFWGDHFDGRFSWAASVGNGSESTNTLNQNKKFQYALRLSGVIVGDNPYGDLTDLAYSETPSLGIGIGGAFEQDGKQNTVAPFLNQYNWSLDGTGDIVFKYRGLAVSLAAYYRQLKTGPGAIIEAGEKYLTDVGYLTALGFFIVPKKFEVQGFASQIFREGPDNNVYEFGGGFNYYINGHNAKLQADYSRVIDYDTINGTNNQVNNRIRAKMQLYF